MSEMKIPKDPFAIPKAVPKTEPTEDVSTLSPYQLDSLETIVADGLSAVQAATDAPQLPQPTGQSDSMLAYFQAISKASLEFKQQLAASDQIDLNFRKLSSLSATQQVLLYNQLLEKRDKAINEIKSEARQAYEEFQKKVDAMQKDRAEMQKLIDQFNQGNAIEKQRYQELAQAYDAYSRQLEEMGVIDQGDGTYLVPEEAAESYNAATKKYQKAVEKFNTYENGRQSELNAYRQAVEAYNQKAAENNQFIQKWIEKYQLADDLEDQGIEIPHQSFPDVRDLAGAPNPIETPALVDEPPSTITSPPLDEFFRSIATSGPPTLSSLDRIAQIERSLLVEAIYTYLYDIQVETINQDISKIILFWQFTQSLKNSLASSSKALLNTKPISHRILPESTKAPSEPRTILAVAPSDIIPLQSVGVDDPQLEAVLGKLLIKQTIEEILQTDVIAKEKKINDQTRDQLLDHLADQLVFFSIGLLGNTSLQALFPSIAPLAKHLATLPPDSPALTLLFAISFANRILEDTNHGVNHEALQVFIQTIPELADLPEADLNKLLATIQTGQLMVAVKLLETALGLPDLTIEILLPASFKKAEEWFPEISEARQPLREKLQQAIEDKFLLEGFPKEEAKFLSELGVKLSDVGFLAPAAPSIPTPAAINKPLLVDSVKAALILNKISLKKADPLAKEVVEATLAETPYVSPTPLRMALETHLQDLGLKEIAPEIARQAIILPPEQEAFVLRTPAPIKTDTRAIAEEPRAIAPIPPETSTSTLSVTTPKSPQELFQILERRALQLLVPQVGMQVAKEVTSELAKTLFGNSAPQEKTMAEIRSPILSFMSSKTSCSIDERKSIKNLQRLP